MDKKLICNLNKNKLKQILLKILLLLPLASFSQKPEMVKFDFLESLMKNNSDTTFVINFWATWCAPCVKELPAFEKLNAEYQNKKVKIILVSMNFKSEYNTQLIPFIQAKDMKSEIVLMDEPDYNSWIDKVDKSWGGAIPSTLLINNPKKIKQFYEKEFTFDELKNKINPLID
jgi:thiol-disulfide isomerase/thioredoxin